MTATPRRPTRASARWAGCCVVAFVLSTPLYAQPVPVDADRADMAMRYLGMTAYLQALGEPPCQLSVAPPNTVEGAAADERLLGTGPRRRAVQQRIETALGQARWAGASARIDAMLKAGEQQGVAMADTCAGLLEQFSAARSRAARRLGIEQP